MKKLLCLCCIIALSCNGCTATDEIILFCREEGSGTREIFVKQLGIQKQGVDSVSDDANITASGAVMLAAVSGNENAIGFISAAATNKTVKTISINGKSPQDGEEYILSRDFILAFSTRTMNAATVDFLSYVKSEAVAEITREMGYYTSGVYGNYSYVKRKGKVVIGGSASVFPLMDKIRESYLTIQPDVQVEIQQNDSSTGISLLSQGMVDIAMSSREVKFTELDDSYYRLIIAKDAIAVIVHPDNPISELSSEQLEKIYEGKYTKWQQVK